MVDDVLDHDIDGIFLVRLDCEIDWIDHVVHIFNLDLLLIDQWTLMLEIIIVLFIEQLLKSI